MSTPNPNGDAANFETAFTRLEAILERMNSPGITLDESLKLFEEADKLINSCNKSLNDAERKVETLIKNRNGDVALGPDQQPMTQNFSLPPRS
ncbi:MAG: exodeoxyribonuclease VII small subunit [Parachlamydiaceae bacterium]|nr:exodeoxyribonuclease VII small subunit [Parachlamydiaceae bacterium]